MKTICKINNDAGKTVHEFVCDDGILYADGVCVGQFDSEEEAIDAVWTRWHDGEWNENE